MDISKIPEVDGFMPRLTDLLTGDEWTNATIVYDAVLGWTAQRLGGSLAVGISESVALRAIAYLKSINADLRHSPNLP